MSNTEFTIGMICIFTTSWMYSLVGVLTRKVKDIHFSLMMFHYGWVASLTILIYLVIEHVMISESILSPLRMFTYSKEQYILLVTLSLFNALGMNLNTLAF